MVDSRDKITKPVKQIEKCLICYDVNELKSYLEDSRDYVVQGYRMIKS